MSSQQKTVLTADDSKVARAMVARALEKYGCKIIEAANGKEAVEAAEKHKPDLILLDITMPVMDGREALAALRGRQSCRAIPVIMLTAERTKEIVLEIAKLGVTGYLLKPFDQAGFDAQVRKVLGSPVAIDRGAVLVVDDSERVLAAASAALESAVKVLTAASGQEAVERYAEARPGVVVIDLAMPGMDGFETLAKIRECGQSACIALTVRGDDSAGEKALKAGYQAVLPKPFQAEGLLEAVRVAQDSLASPEEIAKRLLEDDGVCAVLALPESSPARLAKLLPALRAALRVLVEDGGDKLVIDLTKLVTVDAESTKSIGRLAVEAAKLGLRVALCSPDEKLCEEIKKVPGIAIAAYASDRDAARRALTGEPAVAAEEGEATPPGDPAPPEAP